MAPLAIAPNGDASSCEPAASPSMAEFPSGEFQTEKFRLENAREGMNLSADELRLFITERLLPVILGLLFKEDLTRTLFPMLDNRIVAGLLPKLRIPLATLRGEFWGV